MIKVVEFDPVHLEGLELKDCYKSEKLGRVDGPAVTLLHEGKPVAILGGAEIVPGVVHAWGRVSVRVSTCRMSFHRTVSALLVYFMKSMQLRRVQIHVQENYQMGIKWAKSLGFEPEGLMRKYGEDGSGFILMARVA